MHEKTRKKVGSCIYVHRQYEDEVIPAKVLRKAKKLLKTIYCGDSYTCVKYDKKTGNITFQWSSTFDSWDEPKIDKCFLVKADGTSQILPKKNNPQIWHRKYLWVKNDYKGFDVEKSKERSKQWEPYVTKEEKRKIGTLSFWNSIKHRWEDKI